MKERGRIDTAMTPDAPAGELDPVLLERAAMYWMERIARASSIDVNGAGALTAWADIVVRPSEFEGTDISFAFSDGVAFGFAIAISTLRCGLTGDPRPNIRQAIGDARDALAKHLTESLADRELDGAR